MPNDLDQATAAAPKNVKITSAKISQDCPTCTARLTIVFSKLKTAFVGG
jgi:hypothetical protein